MPVHQNPCLLDQVDQRLRVTQLLVKWIGFFPFAVRLMKLSAAF